MPRGVGESASRRPRSLRACSFVFAELLNLFAGVIGVNRQGGFAAGRAWAIGKAVSRLSRSKSRDGVIESRLGVAGERDGKRASICKLPLPCWTLDGQGIRVSVSVALARAIAHKIEFPSGRLIALIRISRLSQYRSPSPNNASLATFWPTEYWQNPPVHAAIFALRPSLLPAALG